MTFHAPKGGYSVTAQQGGLPELGLVAGSCGINLRIVSNLDTEAASVNATRNKATAALDIEDLAKNLSPLERQQALLEAKIQILIQEAVATSAIEGIAINPKDARRAILRQMAFKAGLP